MEIERTASDADILVLKLSGRMTMGPELHDFERMLEQTVRQGQNRIAIEMSDVSYIDSSAIGALVASQES